MSCECDHIKQGGERGETNGMACMECVKKHISKAIILGGEFQENNARKLEKQMCIANLACAEDHAQALGNIDLENKIYTLRKQLEELNFNFYFPKIYTLLEELIK